MPQVFAEANCAGDLVSDICSLVSDLSAGPSGGFTPKIRMLYSDIDTVLKFNGGLCAPPRVHGGVQQGCAVSGILYELSLEPMLLKLRTNIRDLVFMKTWFYLLRPMTS